MTIPVSQYTFIPNTLAQSAQVNTEFNTLYGWANGGIDDTNVNHALGFYASSITSTSSATGTFGSGVSATAGYTFIAPGSGIVPLKIQMASGQTADALDVLTFAAVKAFSIAGSGAATFLAPAIGVTPLTVSGVSGQSSDIFDVTLTSGGTKALFVDKNGILNFGVPGGGVTGANIAIFNDGGATNGLFLNLPSSSTNGLRIVFGGSGVALQVTGGGNTYVAPGTGSISVPVPVTVGLSAGDFIAQRGASTGLLALGGSGTSFSMDFNLNNGNAWSMKDTHAAGYSPGFTGTITQSSDATGKSNIVAMPSALAEVLQLQPVTFVSASGMNEGGFTAQQVQPIIPLAVRADNAGSLGLVYNTLVACNTRAIQEVCAALHAAGVAGF